MIYPESCSRKESSANVTIYMPKEMRDDLKILAMKSDKTLQDLCYEMFVRTLKNAEKNGLI